MEDKIIQLLRERGPLPVYHIAKELNVAYGIVQYYVGRLVRSGEVYTVRVGARRYVMLRGQDWLKVVSVEDVVRELNFALKRAKIRPDTPLHEALKTLERTSPHVAEALRLVVQSITVITPN